MAELDPAISLPLLRGLARSTGYTQQPEPREENNDTINNGKSSSASPLSSLQKSTPLKDPDVTTIPSSQKSKDNEGGGGNNAINESPPPSPSSPLPTKLHHLLASTNNKAVVHWMPHGRSFKVCNYSALLSLLLSSVKGHREEDENNDGEQQQQQEEEGTTDNNKMKLTKLLKCWGFHQFESGIDLGTFYHEDFLRCRLDKCVDSTLLMYDEGRISSSSLASMEEEDEDNNDDEEDGEE